MNESAGRSDRWVPVRAGIRNVWEYDRQVFDFAGGRLVLRGPNGSGKSNALALIVPFLLDGIMSASRMDSMPGGRGGRSMKTLLLCLADDDRSAKQYRHDQRTGYVWLEFQKADEYLTIGAGARASKSRDAEAWFFVTSQRPEIDFGLVERGSPLTRGQLAEILGRNEVLDSVDAYRTAVDRALFGVGPQRYRNLVELLMVLRRPYLAGKLDLERLSGSLSDGLMALDPQLLADVAASFEDLQAVQEDLKSLEEALRSVEAFIPAYRGYLTAAARTRGRAAVQARATLKQGRSQVSAAKKAASEAEGDADRINAEQVASAARRAGAESRLRAVLESPAYRDASRLAELRQSASDAEQSANSAAERLQEAEAELSSQQSKLENSEQQVALAAVELRKEVRSTIEAADQSGIAWTVSPEDLKKPDLAAALRTAAAGRRAQIRQVRDSLEVSERARARAESAKEAAQASADELMIAEGRRDEAAAEVDIQVSELIALIHSWAAQSQVEGLEALADQVYLLGEPDAVSLGARLAGKLAPLRETLVGRDARLADRAKAFEENPSHLSAERVRIAAEPVPSPEPSRTRPADRTGRRGAPLFACSDFVNELSAHDRAGIEAALQSSGLLDTWIGDRSSDFDAWLAPGPSASSPTLADVLVPTPSPDCGLSAGEITEALQTVSLEGPGITINAQGEFVFGSYSGKFGKEHVEYIGVEAREELRRRRLRELDSQIAGVTELIAQVHRDREAISAERHRLDAVESALPASKSLIEAKTLHLRTVESAAAARGAAFRTAETHRKESAAADRAAELLRASAASFRLPETSAELADAEQLVHLFEQQAGRLLNARSRRDDDNVRLADARAARDSASDRSDRRRLEHEREDGRAADLGTRVTELTNLLGSDAEVPIKRFEAIQAELEILKAEEVELQRGAMRAAEHLGSTRQALQAATGALDGLEAALQFAHDRLDVIRRPEIWEVLGTSQPPAADADAVADECAALPGTGEPDGNTVERAYRTLMYEIGQGYEAGLSWVDQVAEVQVTSEAGTYPVGWLHTQLQDQVQQQRNLLSERDREIFERHLLSRISEALRDLLNDAIDLVSGINRSLGERPTASGKRVSLRWELESDDSTTRRALELLRRSPELRGPAESEQLRTFFASRIDQMRAEDPSAGYLQVLERVLDYRSWHRFALSIVSAGGGTQRLTRTLFKSLSGGEQAVVLHLPMFAAVSAHYEAANPSAPRLIALDEAFAGTRGCEPTLWASPSSLTWI